MRPGNRGCSEGDRLTPRKTKSGTKVWVCETKSSSEGVGGREMGGPHVTACASERERGVFGVCIERRGRAVRACRVYPSLCPCSRAEREPGKGEGPRSPPLQLTKTAAQEPELEPV